MSVTGWQCCILAWHTNECAAVLLAHSQARGKPARAVSEPLMPAWAAAAQCRMTLLRLAAGAG